MSQAMAGDSLRVLLVASEAAPYARAGGLGTVIGSLSRALGARGIDTRLLMPRYGWIPTEQLDRPLPLAVPHGERELSCQLYSTRQAGVTIYLVDHENLYERAHVYGPPEGGYRDNSLRFSLLSRAALALCHHRGWWPHVLHVNDWPTALVPLYLNTATDDSPLSGAATVLTIHNLAHQGWFQRSRASDLGLAGAPLEHLGLEMRGSLNFLRSGIHHSTLITTVSPTYAREIQTPAFGEGLDDLLRSRQADLFGVLNGIDEQTWDPSTDPHLPRNYSTADPSGKVHCKAALQTRLGFPLRPEVPLLGVISRLSAQKGIDLLTTALDKILQLDVQLVVLGIGEPWAERFFLDAARAHPARLSSHVRHDEKLAHLIVAGADLLLMPSRWEPCGLNQMCCHRYGTLPVARATGGLEDTLLDFDERTGAGDAFKFGPATADALLAATSRAVRVFADNKLALRSMIRAAMSRHYGWDRSAAGYEQLYRLAVARRHGA